MVIIATTANNNLHHLQTFNSQNSNNNLRDASFSSYLTNNEQNFSESSHPFINNRELPLHKGTKKEDDGEIGVFEAEKYFNGEEMESPKVTKLDAIANKYKFPKDEETSLQARRFKVQYGTPSVNSESSLNSQHALLQGAMRNSSSRNKKNKGQRKSFLASLGCKCYCSDENSVDISDHAGEITFNKNSSHGKSSKNLFNADPDGNHSVKIANPHAELLIKKDVLFPKPEKLEIGMKRENSLPFSSVNSTSGKIQEKPRKSLEVFGSPILDSRSKSLSFDKRMSMTMNTPWDAAPKMEEEEEEIDNDAKSDASSDLFEIESLTGKPNSFFFKPTSNLASGSGSGCASPTNCYAPSEASIEWSVVTASALDFEDQRSIATIRSPIRTSSLTSSNAKPKVTTPKRRPSMLLGCKSHKSVGVAVNALTIHEKPNSNPQKSLKSQTLTQVTRFQAETKEGNFGARHGQHASYVSSPLQRSHSSHASHLLYI